mmetsp:Transcript_33394/g.38003  ORF Transcript_33394/g.38003 Transcript_33394/m.38003 type:complete len:591 (-) Transcript_33394:55-1827(-)
MTVPENEHENENEDNDDQCQHSQTDDSIIIINEPMMQDEEEHQHDHDHDLVDRRSSSLSSSSSSEVVTVSVPEPEPWEPSGTWWKDALYFVGPGWLVSIAYIDPGNYQADIQAGATTQYYLLFTIWWSSILSIYVQVLCVRLGYYTQQTLAEVQANEFQQQQSTYKRYFAWFIAEFSVILTDLPEVIGIGIACNLFFGWPYPIGVLMSLITTMSFLATMQYGMHIVEGIIVAFVGIMSVALFVEMSFVKTINTSQLMKGWIYGFVDVTTDDLFTIAGILGAVVMPHNLYLHTASVQSRKVVRRDDVVRKAVWYCSIEPILPILVSFFVNLAVVAIAAERVYGTTNAATVGLTDFCNYFIGLKGGCLMWGIALLAAGQSSAITTTYTGQYIMDGFLQIRLPVKVRAIITRMVAITPCVIVSIFFPTHLNQMVNIVNASLGFLLPFALLPLIKYNCSEIVMGHEHASKGIEKIILYSFGVLVWFINAITLPQYIIPTGSGSRSEDQKVMDWSIEKICWVVFHIVIQVGYAWWNFSCLFTPVMVMTTRHNSILLPATEEDEELIEPTPLTSSCTTTTTVTVAAIEERECFHIE